MASETMAETNVKMSDSSSGAQIGDLIKHRMIVTNGGTLGNPAVGPTVLEMNCSTENATEDSIDRQKYTSRQKEHKEDLEDGAIIKHRDYEELAERSRVQTTEDAEVSSNSTIKFEENEKIREKDGTSKVAEYNAKCSEKHETTVSTVEKIGDRQFTRRRSTSKAFTRTCKRIEDMENPEALSNGTASNGEMAGNTETNESNETSESSGFEKGATDDVLVKRSEKTTKSERCSTTISGNGDPSVFDKYEDLLTSQNKQKGALIDLGALGEIKLSTKVVSSGENTLEKDFQKSDYFNPDLAGLDFGTTTSSKEGDEKQVEISNGDMKIEGGASADKDFFRQVKEHAQERTAAATSLLGSRQTHNSSNSNTASSLQEESKQASSISNSSHNSGINSHSHQMLESASSETRESKAASETRESREASSKSSREHIVSMAEQNGHAGVEEEVLGHKADRRYVGGGGPRDHRQQEEPDEPWSLPPSFNRRRYHDDTDEEYDPQSLPPPFAPKNRAETDDLIKRILAEAKGGGGSAGSGGSAGNRDRAPSSSSNTSSPARMNGTASDSIPSPTSPASSPLASPITKEVSSPLSPLASPITKEASSPLSPGGTKIKVNMGGEKDLAETSSTVSSASETSASASKIEQKSSMKSESLSMKSESMSMQSESSTVQNESMQNSSSKAVGAERKRYSSDEDEMSLFERRLAKGVEKKLANIFSGDEEGRNSMESDHSRSSYASERSRGATSAMDQSSSSYSRLEQSSATSNYSKSSKDYDDQSKLYSRKSGREENDEYQSKYLKKNDQDEFQSNYLKKNDQDEFQSKYLKKNDQDEFQSKYLKKNDQDELNGYLSKYKSKEKDEFDELDDEINAWRKNFREQQARKQRAYMEESEEDMALVPMAGRGRLVRQGYMDAEEDDDDAFALVPLRPPPELIPDEEFTPQRRAETTEIVEERTQEIRTVVDKQGAVLEKLRRASSSFDELTSEIKNIKQQLIENSARRSFLMDDGFEDEDGGMGIAPPPPRAGRLRNYPSGSQSFDFSSYTPGSYSSFRANRLADAEYSDNLTSGDSLSLARYKKPYSADDDFTFPSMKTSGYSSTSSTSKSRFASKGIGRFGRSKSLYDDFEGDQQSDGDEFEEYKPKSRQLPKDDDDQPSYKASVGAGYGSGHGSGDPDLGRSSYRSHFSSEDDSSATTSNRLSYTSRFSSASGASSASSGGYRSRLSRANTLSDFDKYSSSSSGFTSRFLQKVRDKKKENTEGEGSVEEAPKKSKAFKSRFLRASFDSSDFTSKSNSYVSRFRGGNTDSSFSGGSAKKSSDSTETSTPSNDSAPAASDKPEE